MPAPSPPDHHCVGADPATASIVVVAVHGRDQSPAYMVEQLVEPVATRLDPSRIETSRIDTSRIETGGIAWILPAAPAGSWYPMGLLAPSAANQPALDDALDVLAQIEADLGDRDPGTVLWCGFSQGACLVTEHVARHTAPGGARRGGLAALTGGLMGPPGAPLAVHAELRGMPAYFGVGDADEWIPTGRVHETAEVFHAAGADVTVDVIAGRPHEISDHEIDRVAHLIASITTPGRATPATGESSDPATAGEREAGT